MTTGKGEMPEGGAEPPTKLAEQRTAPADRQSAATDPWYRRVSFWRAVAGMAVAIALGCAAVAQEIAGELSSRTAFFHRRVEFLISRNSELRTEAANTERQLARMHAERTAPANINRVLSATDVMVLRLTPGAGSSAHGLLAISREAGGAIIEIGGLPAASGKTCVIWWLPARRSPAKASEFNPDADGRVSLAVPMPPRGARIAGAIITLESGKPVDQPQGRIMLKGVLPMPQVLS
jgi:Anti-sigma-K factor rskA